MRQALTHALLAASCGILGCGQDGHDRAEHGRPGLSWDISAKEVSQLLGMHWFVYAYRGTDADATALEFYWTMPGQDPEVAATIDVSGHSKRPWDTLRIGIMDRGDGALRVAVYGPWIREDEAVPSASDNWAACVTITNRLRTLVAMRSTLTANPVGEDGVLLLSNEGGVHLSDPTRDVCLRVRTAP